MQFVCPLDLCEKVFDVLSLQLVTTADRTLTFALTHLESYKHEDLATLIWSFQVLEREILKIEKQFCGAMDCLFPVVSGYLFMSTIMATCSSYAILRQNFVYGMTVGFLSFSYFIIIRLCRMGSRFENKVKEVLGKMYDLRSDTVSPLLRTQIVNVVVTYLVILVQIGNQSTKDI
ncbi:hypothetical protein Pmani_011455 [Petrolisthes manimaculis]|uniref:Uncharacterized protein n=1 Tax=Petrolisthes manimaculis TaxID=1843537 RepID=A0AAE1UG54_9EUCA|nr:hypothetical protein Pmani_011455 [Petrolisthes manimaculis]